MAKATRRSRTRGRPVRRSRGRPASKSRSRSTSRSRGRSNKKKRRSKKVGGAGASNFNEEVNALITNINNKLPASPSDRNKLDVDVLNLIMKVDKILDAINEAGADGDEILHAEPLENAIKTLKQEGVLAKHHVELSTILNKDRPFLVAKPNFRVNYPKTFAFLQTQKFGSSKQPTETSCGESAC